ncbi:MAG: hypothetical protein WA792_18370 [Pseudolabrys sp.]
MAHVAKEWIEHQRKRWTRHDARRWLTPGFRAEELKFDPNQPRVPAGTSAGGQWAGGSGANETIGAGVSSNIRLAARISPEQEKACEEQYRDDIFKCNLLGTASCWSQANFRYSQCLVGGYVPPIYF